MRLKHPQSQMRDAGPGLIVMEADNDGGAAVAT
jgi:hypothetical protein